MERTEYLHSLSDKDKDSLRIYIASVNPLVQALGTEEEKITSIPEFIDLIQKSFDGVGEKELDSYIIGGTLSSKLIEKYQDEISALHDIGKQIFSSLQTDAESSKKDSEMQ